MELTDLRVPPGAPDDEIAPDGRLFGGDRDPRPPNDADDSGFNTGIEALLRIVDMP